VFGSVSLPAFIHRPLHNSPLTTDCQRLVRPLIFRLYQKLYTCATLLPWRIRCERRESPASRPKGKCHRIPPERPALLPYLPPKHRQGMGEPLCLRCSPAAPRHCGPWRSSVYAPPRRRAGSGLDNPIPALLCRLSKIQHPDRERLLFDKLRVIHLSPSCYFSRYLALSQRASPI
jgi:hypothetical protein